MSKPKKLQYNGDSKVLKYLVTCANWFLDNHSVDKLDDVTITDLDDGQVLKYDSQIGKFVNADESGGGGSGTMNYNELENKPQINGIVLIGNKTASDLNLVSQNDLDNYVTDTELSTELADYATNASVVSALASKQDTLTTTQLTAVNSGITSSLVSQITTNQNNILNAYGGIVNKNKLDYTLSTLKAINTAGAWSNNVYTRGNTTFTVNDDNTINVTSLGVPNNAILFLNLSTPNVYGGLRLNGCPNDGSSSTYHMNIELSQSPYSTLALDVGNGSIVGTTSGNISTYIKIDSQLSETITFKPMISDSTDTAEYQPYTYDMITISNLLRGLANQ